MLFAVSAPFATDDMNNPALNVVQSLAEMLRKTSRNSEADNAEKEAAKYPAMEI